MSWAIACERATSQPLQHLLDKLYAASAVTVACFVLCAAASAVLHVSWRCIPSGDRSHVWKLYGPFTAFSCIGCCAGACAWACHMQSHVFLYQSSTNGTEPQDTQYKLQAQVETARWDAAFNILYPFEFIFISLVKIMVLDRMLDFALSKMGPHSALQRAKTAFLGLLLAGITAGLAANITSAVYRIQNANFVTSAAAAVANQTTVDLLLLDASSILKQVDFAGSIQQWWRLAAFQPHCAECRSSNRTLVPLPFERSGSKLWAHPFSCSSLLSSVPCGQSCLRYPTPSVQHQHRVPSVFATQAVPTTGRCCRRGSLSPQNSESALFSFHPHCACWLPFGV